MSGFSGNGWEYLWLFLAGFCATQPWRYAGVLLSTNIDTDSEILEWVRLVSTSLVAGLVGRMLLLPAGALASVPLEMRIAAFLFGIAIFFMAKKSLAAGILAGGLFLLASQYLAGSSGI